MFLIYMGGPACSNIIMRELAPQFQIPWSIPLEAEDIPIVPTTSGTMYVGATRCSRLTVCACFEVLLLVAFQLKKYSSLGWSCGASLLSFAMVTEPQSKK